MWRHDVINFIGKTHYDNNFSYLEIGVENPDSCFNRINSNRKTSVDPTVWNDSVHIDYVMTSDDFFKSLEEGKTHFNKDYKWDVIFIDGLHLADQVYRDIQNSLKHCKGFVLLHDCTPLSFQAAHSDYDAFIQNRAEWNGTTWKAFYKYRTETFNNTYTVNTDYGIGVIEVNEPSLPIAFNNKWFEYGEMKKNVFHDMGLISCEDFLKNHQKNNG